MSCFRIFTRRALARTLPVVLIFTVIAGLSAEEKTKRKINRTKTKVSLQDIESALQSPSRLKFADSNRITLGELFKSVADVHGVQIRVDKNLAALLVAGRDSMLVAEGEIPGSSEDNSHGENSSQKKLASGFKIPFPIQVVPVYSGANLVVGGPSQQALGSYAQPNPTANVPTYSQGVVAYPQLNAVDAISPSPIVSPTNPQQANSNPPVQNSQPATPQRYQARKPVEENQEAVEEIQQTLQLSSRVIELLLETEITTVGLTQPQASLESVLSHALDHVTTLLDALTVEEGPGYPFAATHAYDLTLVYEKDYVLITTIAASNLRKTTKVYSVSDLGVIDAESLANVITKTIRPWSWRSQINSLVEQVAADWPESVSIPNININLTGVSTSGDAEGEAKNDSTTVDLKSLKTMGQLISTGTIAAAHTMISGTEMLHYADPPTADIETLPGMLIITQSQGAHREIKDLISQLKNVNTAGE